MERFPFSFQLFNYELTGKINYDGFVDYEVETTSHLYVAVLIQVLDFTGCIMGTKRQGKGHKVSGN